MIRCELYCKQFLVAACTFDCLQFFFFFLAKNKNETSMCKRVSKAKATQNCLFIVLSFDGYAGSSHILCSEIQDRNTFILFYSLEEKSKFFFRNKLLMLKTIEIRVNGGNCILYLCYAQCYVVEENDGPIVGEETGKLQLVEY